MGRIIAHPQIAQSHRVPYVYPLLPPEFRLIRCSWPRRPRCGPRAPWGCPTSSWRQLHKNRSSRKIHSQRQFSREYDFLKTFSLTENQFSGKTYFYTIASSWTCWTWCWERRGGLRPWRTGGKQKRRGRNCWTCWGSKMKSGTAHRDLSTQLQDYAACLLPGGTATCSEGFVNNFLKVPQAFAILQLPCCPRKHGEHLENIF